MKVHDYPDQHGHAHRKIDLRIIDPKTGEGWLEDDFHHFGVSITHHRGKVTSVEMRAPRSPWSTCKDAAQPLSTLVGKPIVKRASDLGIHLDMRKQCTHVFDLTGLLLAHIGNADQRKQQRRYHTVVADRSMKNNEYNLCNFGSGTAILYQDGELVMQWGINGESITSPPEFNNLSLHRGFRDWTEKLTIQEAEHALILRRAIYVSTGRVLNTDDYATAAEMAEWNVCHTFQPGVRELATRNYGNTKNYSNTPDDILANIITRS